MAKPAVSKPSVSKNKKPKSDPPAQPALRWQLGGLIAGVAVAILSSTEPGKQVRWACIWCCTELYIAVAVQSRVHSARFRLRAQQHQG